MGENDKSVSIYSPAYVSMDIYHDGDVVGGSIAIDDKVGWCWYDEDDEFLLGLIRIAKSSIDEQFLEKMRQSDVTKEEIKSAIKHSIEKNPSDGLYALLGDNATYTGFGVDGEWEDIKYDIQKCLEENGLPSEKADDVADTIIGKAVFHQPSTREVFEKLEKRYTENMYPYAEEGKSWKDVVMDAIDKCDEKHKDASGFVDCVTEKLNLDLDESFYGEYYETAYDALHEVDKDDIKDVSNETGIDSSLIEKCIIQRD